MEIIDRMMQLYAERRILQAKEPATPIYGHIAKRIREEYGVSYSEEYIRIKIRRQRQKNLVTQPAQTQPISPPFKESSEMFADGRRSSEKLVQMSDADSKNPEFLLNAHGFDTDDWVLVSARNNIWNAYSKQDGIQTLYSSRIMVKPRAGGDINIKELVASFEQLLQDNPRPKIPPNKVCGDHMLEIPIMDLHFGKLCWGRETGNNFDNKIASSLFLGVIGDFVEKTKGYQFREILFPLGQDFFNFDDIEGNTTNGTRQDNDARWQKVYTKGLEALIAAITFLSDVAPVRVFYVPGNHDKMTSFYATSYIDAWFRRNENVVVDIEPTTRKYVEFGNNLIGYTHGDKEGKRLPLIMQTEAREQWGRTQFHEWHIGHWHNERFESEEKIGVNIRTMSSICGTDAWHAEMGFIGSVRKAQAFVWNERTGLSAIFNSVIDGEAVL